jgi:hypothetical protein
MHTICCCSFPTCSTAGSNVDNNSVIFYNFVGNFVPPEWCDLISNDGNRLSKTAKQLLSLIVFRLQIYHNNSIDELQETYYFFQESLRVCQERVRQCLLELQKLGFINLYRATIIKHGIKCHNTPCVKLARVFRPYSQKISSEDEKNLGLTPKSFGVNPKEVLPQPQKSLDHSLYIDNKDNISNKSRSIESKIFKNEKNLIENSNNQQLLQQKLEQNSPFEQKLSDERQMAGNTASTENLMASALPLGAVLQQAVQHFSKEHQPLLASNCSNSSAMPVVKGRSGRFRRKILADFYPLNQEDADLLQIKSGREFNLSFINKLLLKLAAQCPNHLFSHKKVLLNYMAKALSHELRETIQANSSNSEFKSDFESSDEDKAKNEDQAYLLELANQLDPNSLWYKARKFLIERYNKYCDIATFSKLIVVKEDSINKKVTLRSPSAFYDYYIRNRHIQDLEAAFQSQGCSFELINWHAKS